MPPETMIHESFMVELYRRMVVFFFDSICHEPSCRRLRKNANAWPPTDMQGAAVDRGLDAPCTNSKRSTVGTLRLESRTAAEASMVMISAFFFSFVFFFSFFFHGRRMGLVLFGSLCRLQDSVIHRSFPGLYVRTIFGAAKEIWMGIRITDDHVTSGLFFV